MIIADTSGLLAALDPDEVHHEACRGIVEASADPLLLSPLVLCELDYLVGRKLGVDAELTFLGDVASGAYRLVTLDPGDIAAAQRVIERYRDLRLGVTDASLVVLADRRGVNEILTLDARHFRAVRRQDGTAFRLLPEDA